MTVTPSGVLSLPLDYLMTTIANCATWKSWTGAADVAAAKELIAIGGIESPTYPACVVTPNAGDFAEAVADGNPFSYERQGVFYVMFKAEISEADGNDAYLDFRNKVGAIWGEMEALGGKGGYLSIHQISVAREQRRSAIQQEKHTTPYFDIILQVEWGL